METETMTAGHDTATGTQLRQLDHGRWLLGAGGQCVRLTTAELQAITQLAYDTANVCPQLWTDGTQA